MLTYNKSLTGSALILRGTDVEIAKGLEIIGGRFSGTPELVRGAAVLRASERTQKAMARSLERAGICVFGVGVL